MLNKLWDSSTKLFSINKIEKTFESELPRAKIKMAWMILGTAVILSVIISIINMIETAHFSIFSYETLSEVADIEEIKVDWSPLWPYVISRIMILVPATLIITYVFELINYNVLKRTGGKGKFAEQFYLFSLISFAMMISSGLLFIAPVPCLGMPVVLLFILLSLYFGIYVTSKAYQIVHRINLFHALAVIIIFGIPKIITMFLINELFGVLELPELPFELIRDV